MREKEEEMRTQQLLNEQTIRLMFPCTENADLKKEVQLKMWYYSSFNGELPQEI
jgi:hypothetical protein